MATGVVSASAEMDLFEAFGGTFENHLLEWREES